MRYRITPEMVEAAVLGGAVLGGGGGGSMEDGRKMGRLALEFGRPELITVDELPNDAVLVTVSAVGSPASADSPVVPQHYVKALEILTRAMGLKVSGLITNECGGLATVNGWLQAAVLGIPVVDAPCNGRAHPTGVMGSMGLHKVPGYVSIQASVGGDESTGTYLETTVRGNLQRASSMVRQTAVQCGGLVAVGRNPVTASYARDHAAVGVIRRCIDLGNAMLDARKQGRPVAAIAASFLGGVVMAQGKVLSVDMQVHGGFDTGTVIVDGPEPVELTFWNEYVTAEVSGQRHATFPDLIATLRTEDGTPYTTASIKKGQDVTVIVVPRKRLILGAGMRDVSLFESIEKATGKQILKYAE